MTGAGVVLALATVAGVALILIGGLLSISWLATALREAAAQDLATRRLQLKVDALGADYEIRLLCRRAQQAWSSRIRP